VDLSSGLPKDDVQVLFGCARLCEEGPNDFCLRVAIAGDDLGKLALRAIGETDLPIVMGVVVFATFAIIVFNLLIDLLYAWIDPRIRLS